MKRTASFHGHVLCAAFLVFAARPAFAQATGDEPAIRFGVFGSVANGRVFRIGDNPLDSGVNVGAGFGVRHRSGLGVEFEYNQTLGLSPSPAACGVAGVVCEGSASNGVSAANIASVNAFYQFGRSRVQPYVTGGIGALMSNTVSSILYVRDTTAIFEEQRYRDTGVAVNFGGGIRFRLSRSLYFRPEIRMYNAVIRSRANLSLFRASVGFGYEF